MRWSKILLLGTMASIVIALLNVKTFPDVSWVWTGVAFMTLSGSVAIFGGYEPKSIRLLAVSWLMLLGSACAIQPFFDAATTALAVMTFITFLLWLGFSAKWEIQKRRKQQRPEIGYGNQYEDWQTK